ncbi:hypothetical protein AB0D24_22700 [Streptomyces javensis]|uniref:hypothetical protein n=1 Tax=Streptomyces javensis TaxID=114698 RepID=UPI0033DFA9A1
MDLAVGALAEVRSLRPEPRGLSVRLDLGPPGIEEGADRPLAADVANTARGEAAAPAHIWGATGS